MSPEDLEYVTRTVMSEEPTLEGRIAVAHAIHNRVKSGKYGKSHKEVVLAPGQFEPWSLAGSGHGNDPFRHDERGREYQETARLVQGVVNGEIPDPTDGAVNFYAPDAQAKLGRKPPKWASTMEHKGDFGKTKFYGQPAQGDEELPWMAGDGQDDHPEWIDKKEDFFAPTIQQEEFKAAPEPQAPAQWGAGREFLHGATLGFLPQIESKWTTGEWNGPKARELRAAREQYHEVHPFLAPALEMGGSLVSTAPFMALGGGVGGYALREAGAAGLGKFLGGRLGGNALTRGASLGAQGAVQGAAQGALTTELNPEGQGAGESALRGALGGAAGNILLGPAISTIAKPFEEHVNKNLSNLALKLNEKYGLGLRKSQLGGRGSELAGLESAHVPQELHQEQIEKFNRVLANRVGATDFTPAGVAAAKSQTGQLLDRIASQTTMAAPPSFHQELMRIARDAQATMTDPADLRKAMTVLGRVYQETASGQISGKRFRDFTYSGGMITNDLVNSKVPKLQQIGRELRREMFDKFNVTNPRLAPVYDKARQNYRELLAIEPHADASGVIDPTKLLRTVKRKGVSGELRDLAEGGQFMSGASAGQAKAGAKPHFSTGEKFAAGGLGLDYLLSHGNPVSIDWAYNNPFYSIPMGAAVGLRYGANALQGMAVRDPWANQLMLKGYGKGVGPMLQQGAGALGGEIYAGTGLRGKK